MMNAYIETHQHLGARALADRLRKLGTIWQNEGWSLPLRAVAAVLADLIDQGWGVSPVGRTIQLEPPGTRMLGESIDQAKARLRESFRVGRARQLNEPSVQRFLQRMNRPALRGGKISSVSSLVDDGAELSLMLRRCQLLSDEAADAELSKLLRPVVQVCDEAARCEFTGLRLLDIWRYFRHTWSMEYRSIPGRQLPFLIRNAARPNAPVIGIAMLASPVVRMSSRDDWLGWTPSAYFEKLARSQNSEVIDALQNLSSRIEESLNEVRSDDLGLSAELLSNPTLNTVLRIQARAAGAAEARKRFLRARGELQVETANESAVDTYSSDPDPTRNGRLDDADWLALSSDTLNVYKRADTLWRLLAARLVFNSIDWSLPGCEVLRRLRDNIEGVRAVSVALQEFRKAGLSSQVADLSVCGAVAPYNALLGGKLVALVMASVEVREAYRARYANQVSIISSQVAGRPVYRSSDLKVLTTTSLYGIGSSQYNRLRLFKNQYRGLADDIVWNSLPPTKGFGSYHLSGTTTQLLRTYADRAFGGRRVNNRFGEGASPRLRQIRMGLTSLGIDSQDILHHATPRLSYACELYTGAAANLMQAGSSGTIGGSPSAASSTEAIATAWRRRWIVQRVRNPDVLSQVERSSREAIAADLQIPSDVGQLQIPL